MYEPNNITSRYLNVLKVSTPNIDIPFTSYVFPAFHGADLLNTSSSTVRCMNLLKRDQEPKGS